MLSGRNGHSSVAISKQETVWETGREKSGRGESKNSNWGIQEKGKRQHWVVVCHSSILEPGKLVAHSTVTDITSRDHFTTFSFTLQKAMMCFCLDKMSNQNQI